MKTIIFFLTTVFTLLTNCSTLGEIRVTRDDFKNLTLVNLDLVHETQESLATDPLKIISKSFKGYFEYTREIDPKEVKPVKIRLGLSVSSDSEDFSPKGFVKIDEKTFPIELTETKGNVLSGVTTGTGYGTTYGTTNGFTDYSKPHYNSRVTTVSSYNYKRLNGNFLLSKEMEKLILNSQLVVYRIYAGNSTYTFEVDSSDLETLKDFLSNRGQ